VLSTGDILLGVLLPFVLAAGILKLARLMKIGGQWTGPVAVGVAFTVAFGCIEGAKHLFPPASAVPWLFYVGVLFTGVGVLDASVRMPGWLRAVVIFLATGLGAGLLLRFNFTNQTWDALRGALWLGGIAIVAVIWWACFENVAREGGVVMPVGAMMVCGMAGLVVMLVSDQTVGQPAGALAVALAGVAAVVGWFGDISLARGTAAVIAGVGVCMLAMAYFISGVPMVDLGLVAAAPLVLAAGAALPNNGSHPSRQLAIRLMIVLFPLGIALGLAVAQFQREKAENSADPYSEARPVDVLRGPVFA
jgi:hypothetical protein